MCEELKILILVVIGTVSLLLGVTFFFVSHHQPVIVAQMIEGRNIWMWFDEDSNGVADYKVLFKWDGESLVPLRKSRDIKLRPPFKQMEGG